MTKQEVSNYLILLSAISKGKKLFVVLAEDDMDDQMLFEEAAVESNVPVKLQVVSDGEQLMNLLLDGLPAPDVIFLDLNMPCMNGFECLDKIRGTDNLKEIPIVIFSTSVNKMDIIKSYNKGANLYFPKPYSFEHLVDSLKKLFTMDISEMQKQRGIENYLFQYK